MKDERSWALFAHLSALSGIFIPFGNILGPLIVWMMKKDESRFVDHQGKEALNFQITITLVVMLAGIVTFIGAVLSLLLIGLPLLFAGMIAMFAFYIMGLVFAVVAAIKSNEGVWYRYPMTWRFIQ